MTTMKWDIRILRWLIWIVSVGFIVLNLWDLYVLLSGKSKYIFGAADAPAYSVFASRELYISYIVVFTISLVAMIYFSYKRSWHAFLVSFLLALLLYFYPLLTGT
jgi:hypothetical protein